MYIVSALSSLGKPKHHERKMSGSQHGFESVICHSSANIHHHFHYNHPIIQVKILDVYCVMQFQLHTPGMFHDQDG
jgi:L-asparaginase II